VAETGVVEVEVTTWSLELRRPSELSPSLAPDLELALVQAKHPSPELGRFLYTAVGGNWYWIDRLAWTSERWLEWLARTGVETWVAYLEGTPAGYFELDGSSGSEVEIAYFGLLPGFIGKKLGGWLLTQALARAWEMGPERVWVHTCSLDGPHALANYQARGMRVFKVETKVLELPPEPPGPWPGGRSAVSS
jgi:GNAT superfamily N-acetyltransferase